MASPFGLILATPFGMKAMLFDKKAVLYDEVLEASPLGLAARQLGRKATIYGKLMASLFGLLLATLFGKKAMLYDVLGTWLFGKIATPRSSIVVASLLPDTTATICVIFF